MILIIFLLIRNINIQLQMQQDIIQNDNYQKIQVSNRNRARLIMQNKKLLLQIGKLQNIISIIIEKDAANQLQSHQENQQIKVKFHVQLDQQSKIIQRQKKQIKNLRSALTDNQIQVVKKEENQITYLTREADKLLEEKRIMVLKKNQKTEALEYYKPINNQTAQTLQKYRKTKSTNADFRLKIHELQRQIAKYHKYKQLGKSCVPKEYDNPEYHFMKMDNEIRGMRKEMKRIQQKWKYKVESLDKEYFSFKSILIDKKNTYENLQKEIKGYENRMASLRDSIQVNLDRERINGIIISPTKRKEMQQMIDEEKKKFKRLKTNNRDKKMISPQKVKKTMKQIVPNVIPEKSEQNKSQKLQLQQALNPVQTHYSQKKNQQNKKLIPDMSIKPTKIVQSIGVGTTFYYSDD